MGSTKFTSDWFDLRKCNLNDWMRMTEFWKIDLFRWAFWKRLIIWQFMMSDEKVIGFSSSQLRWLDGNSLIGDDFFPSFFFFFFGCFFLVPASRPINYRFEGTTFSHYNPFGQLLNRSCLDSRPDSINAAFLSRRGDTLKNKEHTPTHTHTHTKKTRNVGRLSIAHIDRYHNDTARVNFH